MQLTNVLKAGFKSSVELLDVIAKLFDETENKTPEFIDGEYMVNLGYAIITLSETVDNAKLLIKRTVVIEVTDSNYLDSLLEFMVKLLPKIRSSMVVPSTEIELTFQLDVADQTNHQFATIRFANGNRRKNRKVLSMCSASVLDNHAHLSNFSVSYVLK